MYRLDTLLPLPLSCKGGLGNRIKDIMAQSTNKEKMLRGELYHAFTPELIRERQRCANACKRFNNAKEGSRRELVGLWRECVCPFLI